MKAELMRVIGLFLFYQLKLVKHRQQSGLAELRLTVFLQTLGSMSEIADLEKI